MSKIKCAFNSQKCSSRKRGIPFLFTFEGWVSWWETQLGPDWFQLRGRGKGKYQMARNNDEGPYAEWNVKCLLHEKNISDGNLGRIMTPEHRRKLSIAGFGNKKGCLNKGKPFTQGHKDNIRKSALGRKASLLTREKMKTARLKYFERLRKTNNLNAT